MFGSFRLGTILGIPVGVNWSVLLIAWLIAFSLAGQLLPAQVPGLDAALYWAVGALAAVLFFGSLLAHELSHAIVARREGLTVSGITLWLLLLATVAVTLLRRATMPRTVGLAVLVVPASCRANPAASGPCIKKRLAQRVNLW